MRMPTGVKAAVLDAAPLQLLPILYKVSTYHENFTKVRISISDTVLIV